MSSFYEYMFGANRQKTSADPLEKVVEDKRDAYHTGIYYTINCRDGDRNLRKLINYIAENGNGGHSFSIVVDPGDKERERHFGWDGDGADRINSIVESKTGEDKELVGILLKALARIYFHTWIERHEEDIGKEQLIAALGNIQDIARQILEGAVFEDHKEDALREIRSALLSNESSEKKLGRIKYQVDEALKR